MGKINILEPNVFNMISAGEVVERPSSVVKELVENSIDAGATEISIHVEEGGLRKILVSDNGIGIDSTDIRSAFLPHATSKLKNIVDLDSLATLGFRGEALASISSVSEVTLATYSRSEGKSSKIILSGGKVIFEGEDNRAEGTAITVENLFFNTPARLKFLKKPASELNYIKDIVRMLILANPQLSISLSNEEGTLLQNEGGSLIDAIYSVYGSKTADNLIEIIDYDSLIHVSGYVSKVDYTKSNRTYQTIIVNGRAVEDQTVQTAVERAYSEFLMKRTYPMFVLDIVMPFDEVDCNVHPSKTEVRFRDKHAIFSAVFHAVQNTVNASLSNTRFGFDVAQNENQSDINIPQNTTKQWDFDKKVDEIEDKKQTETYSQTSFDTSKLFSGKTMPKKYSTYDFGLQSAPKSSLNDSVIPTFLSEDFTHSSSCEQDQTKTCNTDRNSCTNCSDDIVFEENIGVFDGKIIGQIFDTYIICQRGDFVYVIDQHAAHERILYDRILEKFNVEFKQPLLIPYKVTMTGEECEYFERIIPNLIKLGFDIEQGTSSTYLVKAVPEPVTNVNFSKFFADLFANMLNENELTLENLLKDKLCQQACKGAIKGGDSLTREQLERVIKYYVDENGNLPAKCPHGRPAVIAFTARDIEKLFKRIV